MKKVSLKLLFPFFVAGALFLSSCGGTEKIEDSHSHELDHSHEGDHDHTSKKENPEEHEMEIIEEEVIYACPMHLEITGEKGEKCPKCGMGLEVLEK